MLYSTAVTAIMVNNLKRLSNKKPEDTSSKRKRGPGKLNMSSQRNLLWTDARICDGKFQEPTCATILGSTSSGSFKQHVWVLDDGHLAGTLLC